MLVCLDVEKHRIAEKCLWDEQALRTDGFSHTLVKIRSCHSWKKKKRERINSKKQMLASPPPPWESSQTFLIPNKDLPKVILLPAFQAPYPFKSATGFMILLRFCACLLPGWLFVPCLQLSSHMNITLMLPFCEAVPSTSTDHWSWNTYISLCED